MFGNLERAGEEHEDLFGTKKSIIEAIAAQFGTIPKEVAHGYHSMIEKYACQDAPGVKASYRLMIIGSA